MLSEILIPALAVGATGLAFGALLGFASIVFKVDKDERIDQIAEILPGANCGGCGYSETGKKAFETCPLCQAKQGVVCLQPEDTGK